MWPRSPESLGTGRETGAVLQVGTIERRIDLTSPSVTRAYTSVYFGIGRKKPSSAPPLTGCLLAPEIPNRLNLTTCQGTPMKSVVVKRSVVISGHKTSVSLEDEFWNGLKEIAKTEHASLSNVVAEIDKARRRGNLSSAIRLFVLDRVRATNANVAAS